MSVVRGVEEVMRNYAEISAWEFNARPRYVSRRYGMVHIAVKKILWGGLRTRGALSFSRHAEKMVSRFMFFYMALTTGWCLLAGRIPLLIFVEEQYRTVRLTSTGKPVPGNREFRLAPSETIVLGRWTDCDGDHGMRASSFRLGSTAPWLC